MKLKSLSISKNLLKEFLKANIHISFLDITIDRRYFSYYYGFRNNIGIIDLRYTFENIQTVFFLIYSLLKKKNKIIFFGFPKWLKTKWELLEKLSNNTFVFFDENWDSLYLTKQSEKIGLIFVYDNFKQTEKILHEARKNVIPIAGIVNTTYYNFDFFIIGSFKSKISGLLI